MARKLEFMLDGAVVETAIDKVERKKLYGWVKRQPYDGEGRECYFGTLSGDGMHILGRESQEQGYVDRNGDWIERDELKVLDEYGDPLVKLEASFKAPIPLEDRMSVDDYLLYTAKSVYQVEAPPELVARVQASEDLFVFPFNYVASYRPDTAFLLENEGHLFIIVGEPTGVDYVGLVEPEPALLVEDEDDEGEDLLDFSMI